MPHILNIPNILNNPNITFFYFFLHYFSWFLEIYTTVGAPRTVATYYYYYYYYY